MSDGKRGFPGAVAITIVVVAAELLYFERE